MRSRVGIHATLLFALACTTPPLQRDTSGEVDLVLRGAGTSEELSDQLGKDPDGCVRIPASRELCSWILVRQDPAWARLASSVPTRDRINLLCELPGDGSDRLERSCTVHPRRSNRGRWKINTGKKGVSRPKVRKEHMTLALAQIESATSVTELSRLVGARPDECLDFGTSMSCVWRASKFTYGHGTLAASIRAPLRKKVRMICRVPSDGGARPPDSCSIEIGH